MKLLVIIFSCFIFFLFGLNCSSTATKGQLFEYQKEQYEQEIINPNNNYQPSELVPKDNIVNKTAHKIDDVIEKILEKMKSILRKI